MPKKEGLEQFADSGGGGLGKKEGVVVLRGAVNTPMHTMFIINGYYTKKVIA